jgi:uncharacterized membrane protein YphA (DoxX/SURF4 family)
MKFNNPLPEVTPLNKALRLFLQFLVGSVLLGSAIGKGLDLPGFVEILKTYQAFSEITLGPLAYSITLGEFVLGLWILSGRHLKQSALVAAGMNGLYAAWMTMTLLRGLELPNCGCFGVFFPRPLTWASPIEDLVMVVICVSLSRLAHFHSFRKPKMSQDPATHSSTNTPIR